MNGMVYKRNWADYLMYIATGLFSIFCLIPMVLAICVSIST